MNKLIFFDIDGTLVTENNTVLESTIEALRKLKENGHEIFLCSGRSKGEIQKNLLDLGFDGMVAGAGAYVEYHDQVLFHQPMNEEKLTKLIDFLEKESIDIIIETNDGAYFTKTTQNNFLNLVNQFTFPSEEFKNEYLDVFKVVENLKNIKKVNKLIFFNSKYTTEELSNNFGQNFTFLPSSIAWCRGNSGEVSEKDIHKGAGINKILSFLSKTKEDVIGVGDSLNDLEMLTLSNISIAMGNATDEIKKISNYVTDDVNNDGIYNIFKKLKLIS